LLNDEGIGSVGVGAGKGVGWNMGAVDRSMKRRFI